ncbi:hypothetical protein L5B71_03110 [Avibacterium sp. 21-586]|uniref:hypothetical protein n=1 Tax=Avibacterium sp. 21-586 TaxID=2911534 RepID=UPI0022479434|nr:hypothetical protein [Avibacterium sp. 21-586]MCW9709882.1 hypothetical protein [Avibacterium sp. 21-586]
MFIYHSNKLRYSTDKKFKKFYNYKFGNNIISSVLFIIFFYSIYNAMFNQNLDFFIVAIFIGLLTPLWVIPICRKLPCFKKDIEDDIGWTLLVLIIYVTILLFLLNLPLKIYFYESAVFSKGFEEHLPTLISVLYGSFVARYLVPLFKLIEMDKPNTSQEINKQ